MPGPADYIQQGFGQLGAGIEDVYQKSREPHPEIKRRILEMLHEGKDPRHAAIEAKLAMQGGSQDQMAPPPSVATASPQGYGDGSTPGMYGRATLEDREGMQGPMRAPPQMAPPPQPMPQSRGPMMSRPSTQPGPEAQPFRMTDAMDAKNLGLLREPSDTPEDRMARAILRSQTTQTEGSANRESRQTVAETRTGSAEKIADAGLKEKAREYDTHHDLEVTKLKQDWDKAVLRARTSIANAREGRATAKDVGALKAVLAFDSAIQAQIAGLTKSSNQLGGALGSSPELSKQLQSLLAQHSALEPQVSDALKKAEQIMRAGGGQETSERTSATVPGPMPDTSVPPNVGQMPPRLRGKDGNWYKLNPGTGKYRLDQNQGG